MIKCVICGKHFQGNFLKVRKRNPIYQHMMIHKKAHGCPDIYIGLVEEDQEESMAERHIQAISDEAMGVPNYDREWLI